MFKTLLNSILEFVFSPPNPKRRKMDPYIRTLPPSEPIDSLLGIIQYNLTTEQWLKNLCVVDMREMQLERLDRCHVDEIVHTRQIEGGFKLHEQALLKFHLEPANPQESQEIPANDRRAVCVERAPGAPRQDASKHLFRLKAKRFAKNTCDCIRVDADYAHLLEQNKTDLDCGTEGTDSGEVFPPNKLPCIQSFRPPPGSLTAFDCAVLANVITTAASPYSIHAHMCMWYATVFFLAAKQIASEAAKAPVASVNGTLFKEGGTFMGIRIVDLATANLEIFRATSITSSVLDAFSALLVKFEKKRSSATAAKDSDSDSTTTTSQPPPAVEVMVPNNIANDRQQWANDQLMQPGNTIPSIVESFYQERAVRRAEITAKIDALVEKRMAWELERQRQVEDAQELARQQVKDAQGMARQQVEDAQEVARQHVEDAQEVVRKAEDTARQAEDAARQAEEGRLRAEQQAQLYEQLFKDDPRLKAFLANRDLDVST
ncbi:hypothetical protein MIND_01183900 [Mycena indigotica]|uniref:Uncharacterized protein n=1 Tax=Mycena indigotica TaxID=2126181 RepID=A0A8H6S4P6_9AGAR|nr:uncharacterized protein MIND_01183900 [Mycena indigotica]KAF7292849.1 hypothetical protein MIND_01183900 [Mycena indigotica]